MCCGHGSVSYTQPTPVVKTEPEAVTGKENLQVENDGIALASEDPSKKVKLRYYGGGVTAVKNAGGCPTCGGGGRYALTTAERIMFPSEDAPMGMFKQFFQVGREYYVTEKQAEYLLTLTFRNPAGQTVNKFKRLEN